MTTCLTIRTWPHLGTKGDLESVLPAILQIAFHSHPTLFFDQLMRMKRLICLRRIQCKNTVVFQYGYDASLLRGKLKGLRQDDKTVDTTLRDQISSAKRINPQDNWIFVESNYSDEHDDWATWATTFRAPFRYHEWPMFVPPPHGGEAREEAAPQAQPERRTRHMILLLIIIRCE